VQDGIRQQLKFNQLTCGSELLQQLLQVCAELWTSPVSRSCLHQSACNQFMACSVPVVQYCGRGVSHVVICLMFEHPVAPSILVHTVQTYVAAKEPAQDPMLSSACTWIAQLAELPHDSRSAVTQEVRKCTGAALQWSKAYDAILCYTNAMLQVVARHTVLPAILHSASCLVTARVQGLLHRISCSLWAD
jgi:hypothetical protein